MGNRVRGGCAGRWRRRLPLLAGVAYNEACRIGRSPWTFSISRLFCSRVRSSDGGRPWRSVARFSTNFNRWSGSPSAWRWKGRSRARGEMPKWLKNASDVRVIGFTERDGDTSVKIELQRLGDAAEEIYRQRRLWDELPSPDETAIHVMARAIGDVRAGNLESGRYDLALLQKVHTAGRALRSRSRIHPSARIAHGPRVSLRS